MASEWDAQCDSCQKKWRRLRVLDGEHYIAICPSCSNIVNVSNKKKTCPRWLCRAPIAREHVLINGEYLCEDGEVSIIECPKCEDGHIAFIKGCLFRT